MVNRLLVFLFLVAGVFSCALGFQGTGSWTEFYPFLHTDSITLDSMKKVNVRWQTNQMLRGWSKYRLGLIGNSVTNDGPFPSDMSTGCHTWCGTGITSKRPSRLFWTNFLNETWGGPTAFSSDDHPWLYDTACHGPENGNQIGATTGGGFTLLGNMVSHIKPMWVTIMYGHNNAAVWDETRRSEWDRLVSRALDSNVIPIIVTINPSCGSWYHNGLVPSYNDSLKAYAIARHVPVIDWYGAAVNPAIGGCDLRSDCCTRDGVHPERSQSAGNFSDSILFYPYAQAKGVLNPVCGLLNIMTLEMTYELRAKAIFPADSIVNTGVFKNEGFVPEKLDISVLPNPFNPSITILFMVPKKGTSDLVSVEIFNAAGRKIKTISDRIVEPGDYRAVWNGTDDHNKPVGAGSYYIKLISGQTVKTCKALLAK